MDFRGKPYLIMDCGNVSRGHDDLRCSSVFHDNCKPLDPQPDISTREACCECGATHKSDTRLAFFEHTLTKQDYTTKQGSTHIYPKQYLAKDSYYCGCRGWE